MNAFNALIKVLAAAAVIAGAVFAVIMYGDKIMQLIKKLTTRFGVNVCVDTDSDFVDEEDLVVEESESEPVAADQDFEG